MTDFLIVLNADAAIDQFDEILNVLQLNAGTVIQSLPPFRIQAEGDDETMQAVAGTSGVTGLYTPLLGDVIASLLAEKVEASQIIDFLSGLAPSAPPAEILEDAPDVVADNLDEIDPLVMDA